MRLPVGAVALDRYGLAVGESRRRPAYAFRLKVVDGRLLPGVDLADRDKLFDL
jgi:hypothetical protein